MEGPPAPNPAPGPAPSYHPSHQLPLPFVPFPAELHEFSDSTPAATPSPTSTLESLIPQGYSIRFLSGNPQLYVRTGILTCTVPVDEELILRSSDQIDWDKVVLQPNAFPVSIPEVFNGPYMVCLLVLCVQLLQLPRDLLTLLWPLNRCLTKVSILRHYIEPSKFLAVIECTTAHAANELISALHGTQFNSFESARVLLYPCTHLTYLHLSQSPHTDTDVEGPATCAVCLEPFDFDNPRCIVLNCNHVFHFECVRNLEGPACPVCRFTHDPKEDEHTVCQVCHTVSEGDLWLCLVCGFAGCGRASHDHIKHHYESTLHTYAINANTHTVWDFAGDGFVHRLIVSKGEDDGILSAPVPKLVEVPDPHSRSEERPQRPQPSEEAREMFVHAKLEKLCVRYNHLLHWQLEQMKIHYTNLIADIRNAHTHTDTESLEAQERKGQERWGEQLISSLKQERAKLKQKCEAASSRLADANKELNFLKDLGESLNRNREEWLTCLKAAEDDLEEADRQYRVCVPRLEKKVKGLMIQIEEGGVANPRPRTQLQTSTHELEETKAVDTAVELTPTDTPHEERQSADSDTSAVEPPCDEAK